MPSFYEALQRGAVTTAQALELFDSLEGVEVDFMLGFWRGADFPTGHPMDGLLHRYGWYGKEFVDADHVHPLVFTGIGGQRYTVNPSLMPIRQVHLVPDALNRIAGRIFPWLKPVFGTRKTAARLRMTSFRGKVSAAMIYDRQPIQDVFRRVDDHTVLGVMDLKGMSQPYFFVLRRDTHA
ncbi:MAG TPA: DUF4334 domain-containing protein [Fluviicoccus sp.]|nr:DUF4334 domain-containing protein [Fluviicoccus sp.]